MRQDIRRRSPGWLPLLLAVAPLAVAIACGGDSTSGGGASSSDAGASTSDADVATSSSEGGAEKDASTTKEGGAVDAGDAGGDAGSCVTGSKRCNGATLETCNANAWSVLEACSGGTPICALSGCAATPASCVGLAATCGAKGTRDCCAAGEIPGGTFNRSNDPGSPATVSAFRMDNFEVTVGRMRAFVNAYPGSSPAAGTGKNPNNAADPGWDATYTQYLPADQATLMKALNCIDQKTWSDTPTSAVGESVPINCVTWYVAEAFCIWDGGRLPTEAEWNFAAAGGAEQRVYPWSSPPSSTTVDNTYGYYQSGATVVGTYSPKGDGKWGQSDLSGNVHEWTQDTGAYESVGGYPKPCVDCANIPADATAVRETRGGCGADGSLFQAQTSVRVSLPPQGDPLNHFEGYGFRCARR